MEQIHATPSLDLGAALKSATSKVLQFQGRARRSEYWWTILTVYVLSLLLSPFLTILGGLVLNLLTIPLTFRRLHDTGRSGWWWGMGIILKALFFFVFLYDVISIVINVSGWDYCGIDYWGLLASKYLLFICLIGLYELVMIILCCLDSDKRANRYGESPKYVAVEETEYPNP